MITSVHLDSVAYNDVAIYTSSSTNAVTTIVVCNVGTPDLSNENVNSATLTMNITSAAPNNVSNLANTIIKNLIIPAGETVFLSEERIVLDNGNQLRATASNPDLLSITISTLPV